MFMHGLCRAATASALPFTSLRRATAASRLAGRCAPHAGRRPRVASTLHQASRKRLVGSRPRLSDAPPKRSTGRRGLPARPSRFGRPVAQRLGELRRRKGRRAPVAMPEPPVFGPLLAAATRVGAQLAAVTAADGGLRAHLRQLGTAEAAAAALPFAAVEIVHAPACSAARRPTLARRMTAAAVWIACQAHGRVISHPETPHRPVPPRPRPAFPLRRTARRRRRDDAAHDTPLRRPVRWPPPGRTRSLS